MIFGMKKKPIKNFDPYNVFLSMTVYPATGVCFHKRSVWELKKKYTPTPCKIFYSNIVNSLKNASAQLSYNTSPLTKNNIIVFIDLFSI